jgi:hypothetical protein
LGQSCSIFLKFYQNQLLQTKSYNQFLCIKIHATLPGLHYENICRSTPLCIHGAYTVQTPITQGPDVPTKHERSANTAIALQHSLTVQGKIPIQDSFENQFHTSNLKAIQM